jgi:hypothetical protein
MHSLAIMRTAVAPFRLPCNPDSKAPSQGPVSCHELQKRFFAGAPERQQGVSRIGAIESLSDRMDLPSPLSWVPDWRGGPHQAQWASSP